jgi:hypothetical protein
MEEAMSMDLYEAWRTKRKEQEQKEEKVKKSYQDKSWFYKLFFHERDRSYSTNIRCWIVVPFWIAVVATGLFAMAYGIPSCLNHVSAPSKQAWVQQSQIDYTSTLDVCDTKTRNAVVRANTQVRSMQNYNCIWFFDLAVPDSWDDMEIVPLKNGACYQKTERKDLNLEGLDEINVNLNTKEN